MRRLIPALVLCLLACPSLGEGEQEKKQLEVLKKDIAALRQTLNEQSLHRSKLQQELEQREKAIAGLSTSIRKVDDQIATLQKELIALNQQQQALDAARQQQQSHIAREMDAAFRLGRSEPLKFLLNQEDPEQLNRALKYYRYFVDARSAKISEYRDTMAKLGVIAETIHSKNNELLDNRAQLEQQQRIMSDEQGARLEVLAKIDAELGDSKARLKDLHSQRKELEQILARLVEAIADLAPATSEPFDKLKGKLPWPTQGKVRHAYGSARAQNLPWKGWLIATTEGSPIKAINQGRVVFSDYLRGHGLVLIIDHGNQYLSLYAHNQMLLKDTGDWVGSGETIATAGTSGGLTESALYFEIRHNGQPKDPKYWLSSRG